LALPERPITNHKGFQREPQLPNLQQEELEGWDARLPLTGTDFYYQFTRDKSFSRADEQASTSPARFFFQCAGR